MGLGADVVYECSGAAQLMREGKVQTTPLITHEFPVSEWQAGFDTFEDRAGIKTIFRASD